MAEPLRYRDLVRPSLIEPGLPDTGNVGRLQALAGAFKEFESTAATLAQNMGAQRGAQEGAAAGASGVPALKSTLRAATSKYAQAYNNAATRSYLIKAEADLEDTAARIEQEAGTDAERFGLTFDKVRQQTLNAAPPQLRGALDEMYVKRRGDAMARIGQAAVAEQNKFARVDLSEGVARATDRVANLRASDSPEDLLRAEEEDIKLSLLIDSAVNDGTISEAEGLAAHVNAQRAVTAQTVLARFKRELDNPYGNPLKFIQRLKDANKTSEALPPDQEEKLTDALMAELREHNALAAATEQADSDARRERWLAGNREATAALLNGTLRVPTLQQMVEDDEIDPDTARTLQNELTSGGGSKSDPRALMTAEVNLLDLEEKDILTNPQLSYADKSRLILKQRDEVNGWRGSVPGREAADRIDRALGLVPGSIMNAMLPDVERTKRERAMTDWYNSMVALPPEEREAKAIEVAEQVITRTIRTDAMNRLSTARANLAKTEQELAQAQASGKLSKTAEAELQQKIESYRNAVTKAEQAAK